MEKKKVGLLGLSFDLAISITIRVLLITIIAYILLIGILSLINVTLDSLVAGLLMVGIIYLASYISCVQILRKIAEKKDITNVNPSGLLISMVSFYLLFSILGLLGERLEDPKLSFIILVINTILSLIVFGLAINKNKHLFVK